MSGEHRRDDLREKYDTFNINCLSYYSILCFHGNVIYSYPAKQIVLVEILIAEVESFIS